MRIERTNRTDCRFESVRQKILGKVATHTPRQKPVEVRRMIVVNATPLDQIDSIAGSQHSTSLRRRDQLHAIYLPAPAGLLHEICSNTRQSITPTADSPDIAPSAVYPRLNNG